jgi:hypothetical protein
MGYYMRQRSSKFYVVDEEAALEAIKGLAGKETMGPEHFSWVDTREFLYADTFEEAMRAWRWETDSDWKYILFTGEKLGDDNLLFDAIAPYIEAGVDDGSYDTNNFFTTAEIRDVMQHINNICDTFYMLDLD